MKVKKVLSVFLLKRIFFPGASLYPFRRLTAALCGSRRRARLPHDHPIVGNVKVSGDGIRALVLIGSKGHTFRESNLLDWYVVPGLVRPVIIGILANEMVVSFMRALGPG